jgi:hypothetical protein
VKKVIVRERMKKTVEIINLFMVPPVLFAKEYRQNVNVEKHHSKTELVF